MMINNLIHFDYFKCEFLVREIIYICVCAYCYCKKSLCDEHSSLQDDAKPMK